MALPARTAAQPLDFRAVPALRELLYEDPDSNLFLLGTLHSHGVAAFEGVRWLAVGGPEVLDGVVWIGRPSPDPGRRVPAGLAVPCGDPAACEVIGRHLAEAGPPRMVIGPRAASDGLWRGLGSPQPRVWFDQRLYVCTEVRPGRTIPLRRARPDELELVSEMAGRMMAEDLGADPRDEDPEDHRRKVRARLLAGRTLLGLHDGDIVFKLDEGSRTAEGSQVGGTWVPPHRRGQGLASAGMRAACRELLARSPRITLHVNEANRPAVRTYEATGFEAAAPFRLASV